MARQYHLTKIRALLREGFTAEELRRLCYDTPIFRPVYDELAPNTGKTETIDRLIEYAERKSLLNKLLTQVKAHNPARYEQHKPYYDFVIDQNTKDVPHEEPSTFTIGGLFDDLKKIGAKEIRIDNIDLRRGIAQGVTIAFGVLLIFSIVAILGNNEDFKRLFFPIPTQTPTVTPTSTTINTPTVLSPTPTSIPQPTQQLIIDSTGQPTIARQPFQDTPTPTSTPAPPTPTDAVTGSPTPLPEAIVLANELNLRTGPGIIYDRLGSVKQGDILDIQGRIASNDWIQVIPTNPDTLGWVSNEPNLVQVNVDLNTVLVVTPPPTPTPLVTPMPISSIKYLAPILTDPDNGVGTQGKFPPLYWKWDGQLAEDEYFEVRVWHEELPYHAGLGWVKQPQFDYNVSGERNGKYFWTVVIVKDTKENIRIKDWYNPEQWPYPVWEHKPDIPIDNIQILSPESEPRFFFFTPTNSSGGGSSISAPCSSPPFC